MKHRSLRRLGIMIFWLSVWQLLAWWVDDPILLVAPAKAACALVEAAGEAGFWLTVAWSLARIGAGFALGLAAALALAGLAYRFSLLEEVLSPVITLMRAVPVASFVVLLLIWWGSVFLSVAVCFLIVLPNIYLSTLEGLKNADKGLLEMAEVFRMPFKNRFFYLYRPALKPFLSASLKLALGMCWKSGVAAEIIGTPDFSIGERLYMSKISLDTAGIFAWTAVVILLSFCFERAVLWLVQAFFVWEPACSAPRNGGGTGQNNTASLCCRGLSKSYGGMEVIRGLNEIYEPGQVYYLTSPSGSGKTTLLRLMAGLDEPDEGIVEPKMRFSFAFQEDRLCEEYSAVRNVELVTGGRVEQGENRAMQALSRLLPTEALHKPCSQLSGGMKRRVALVRAMEADSECVLLDEPFTGMDADTRRKAEDYIRARQRGRIVIIATHI